MEQTRGALLASLLLRAFDVMTAEVRRELAQHGHPEATSTHHYAMEAIDRGATDASALGRELGISRQAAAKTIRSLEELGYVNRGADAHDARRRPLEVTTRGHEMTALGAAAFERVRLRLEASEGAERLLTAEQVLRSIAEVTRDE
jgi:DNA-binding MarR family transcriptional regulator